MALRNPKVLTSTLSKCGPISTSFLRASVDLRPIELFSLSVEMAAELRADHAPSRELTLLTCKANWRFISANATTTGKRHRTFDCEGEDEAVFGRRRKSARIRQIGVSVTILTEHDHVTYLSQFTMQAHLMN